MSKRNKTLRILSDKELGRLSTQRLLGVLKAVRAVESDILSHAGRRCCEFCHEYIGNDYENDVLKPAKPYTDYKNKVKILLASRPHIP